MIAQASDSRPSGNLPEWLKPEELAKLDSLELRATSVVEGFLQGLHRSPFVGHSVEFSAHRKYGPGDDLRHLNWKIFAREKKLYVKEFDAETNLNLYLLVDSSRSMQCKVGGALTKHEYAATLASAFANIALKQRDAVSMARMSSGIHDFLEPSAKPGRWNECIRLLSQPAEDRETSLAVALEQATTLTRHRGMVFIFSDLVDDIEAFQTGVQQLRHRGHDVAVFHILDPWERKMPKHGRVRIADLEGDDEVMTDIESVRRAYDAKINNWCETLNYICLHHGVARREITTDMPPTQVLVDFLASRQ